MAKSASENSAWRTRKSDRSLENLWYRYSAKFQKKNLWNIIQIIEQVAKRQSQSFAKQKYSRLFFWINLLQMLNQLFEYHSDRQRRKSDIQAIFYSEKTTDFRTRPDDIFPIFLKVPERFSAADRIIFSLEIRLLKFSVKLVVFSCNRSFSRWFLSSFLWIIYWEYAENLPYLIGYMI